MRLSNTLMMDSTLMPTTQKAFTLAEVLITLSILGVVAALTIPSLVNRQSDLAAQVKIKKAISNYEDVIGIYMAENEKSNAQGMLNDKAATPAAGCATLTDYFKVVKTGTTSSTECNFVTADGVAWNIDPRTGNAAITDNEKQGAARYQVVMWNANNRVNVNNPEMSDNVSNIFQKIGSTAETTLNTAFYTDGTNTASLIDSRRNAVLAPEFMQGHYSCSTAPTNTAAKGVNCSSYN